MSENDTDQSAERIEIDDLGELEGTLKRSLGEGVFIHELDYLDSGEVIAYLGISFPHDTSHGNHREISYSDYAPVGAAIAVPGGDGYRVDCPSRDDLERAFEARREREGRHRAAIIPALKNLAKERKKMHYERVSDTGFTDLDEADSTTELDLDRAEMFKLGVDRGMQKMAGLFNRALSKRLQAPYEGNRRWDSPEYQVIRERRTADFPQVPEDNEA